MKVLLFVLLTALALAAAAYLLRSMQPSAQEIPPPEQEASPAAQETPAPEETEPPSLLFCEYGEYGDSVGASLYLRLERMDESGAELACSRSASAAEEPEELRYPCSLADLRRVQTLLEQYGVEAWGTLPPSEFFAEDAPTRYFRCRTADWEAAADTTLELPEGCGRFLYDLRDLLLSLIPDGTTGG